MSELNEAPVEVVANDCAICHRFVLVGEQLMPHHDPRTGRYGAVCDLCRGRARGRGWTAEPTVSWRRNGGRLRVETVPAPVEEFLVEPEEEPAAIAPKLAILSRATGERAFEPLDAPVPDPALLERVRRQDIELSRIRRELDPARRADEQRAFQRQSVELRDARSALRERDATIQRLQRARHDETSEMRMCGHALDSFNQSSDLERMARIARTLDAPTVNVHDEGPGIPRRVRITLSWDIAWYEFVVKLDLGSGRASVHETGTGGDPTVLPLERRRSNAAWRNHGLVLS